MPMFEKPKPHDVTSPHDQAKPHVDVPVLPKEDVHYSLGYPTLSGIHNRALKQLEVMSAEYDRVDREAVAKVTAEKAAAEAKAKQDALDAAALARAEADKAEEDRKTADAAAAERAKAKIAEDEAAAAKAAPVVDPVVVTGPGDDDVTRRPV